MPPDPLDQTAEEVGAEEMAAEAEIQQLENAYYEAGMSAQQARTAAEEAYRKNWFEDQGRADGTDGK
jgi:hypothetical protein